jgi:hypothetical protein
VSEWVGEYGYATHASDRLHPTPTPTPTPNPNPLVTQLSGAQLAQLLGGARLLEWDRAPEPELSEGACGCNT